MRISAVSYLNTKPFLYGLFKSNIAQEIDIQLDIPSVCAQKLISGEVSLGLIPVAAIPQLPEVHIISNYCIGAVGKVRTVCIYSQVPMADITHLYLDFHSRTSVALAQILLKSYWEKDLVYLKAEEGFEQNINGTTAAVIIGDRAFEAELKHYSYIYDLSEAWMAHTGLPFVFAAWVSTKPLSDTFVNAFNEALGKGISDIPELIYILPNTAAHVNLYDYFTHNISYDLDAAKQKALTLFLQKLGDNRPLHFQQPADIVLI
jgi:chorismate dehydratase